jgi:hypothetical protein
MDTRSLPTDWAFRPALDLELKHYTLLAYLQRVRERFDQYKLYPHLSELRSHTTALASVRREKEDLSRHLHGDLIGFDPHTGEALHETVRQDPSLDVIDDVIDMALPRLRSAWKAGEELRKEIAAHIHLSTVGLLPLHLQEGWLLLRKGGEARVYRYWVPFLRTPEVEAGMHHVRTRFVNSTTVGLQYTFEHIKSELVRTYRELPNPAVFALETDLALPHIETFMPLAKQFVQEELLARA